MCAREQHPELHKEIGPSYEIWPVKRPIEHGVTPTGRIVMSKALVGTAYDLLTRYWSEVQRGIFVHQEPSPQEVFEKLGKLDSDMESVQQELASCREAIDKLVEELDEKPVVKEAKLFDIDQTLEVLEPIPIVIEQFKDEVIASFPEIEVYGIGINEPEAILSLKTEIRNLYYDLIGTSGDELGKLPRCWLRVLERLIQTVGETQRL